jgi:hypothetical protein
MNLKRLRIEENKDWKTGVVSYEGMVEFGGEAGTVALKLTADHCNRIFQVCADGMIDVAKDAARNLTANLIEHAKALEHPCTP